MLITVGDVYRGATFSEDYVYRYELWRRWNERLLILPVIMYNPSLFDYITDDPTLRRVQKFAKKRGYGGVKIFNLFAYRSPYPKNLDKVGDPVGPENDKILKEISGVSEVFVAWGSTPYKEREARVLDILSEKNLICLGVNKDGSPKNPLYINPNINFCPFEAKIGCRV